MSGFTFTYTPPPEHNILQRLTLLHVNCSIKDNFLLITISVITKLIG